MTIGVGIIARNVSETIKPCIESFQDYVDQIEVVLAGESTDNTEEILRTFPKVNISKFEWIDDFAAARNFSISKLNTDWILWVDADDIVIKAENLKKLIDKAPSQVGCIWFPYEYAFDEFGNCTTIYERERLLRASCGWVWRSRLHETVSNVFKCDYVRSDDVIIRHSHLGITSRSERNFRILYKMYDEDKDDRRIWLYLGHQNFADSNWAEAVKWYLKFGQDSQVQKIEKYQALTYASKALYEMGDLEQSTQIGLMAVELFPQYSDAYVDLARAYIKTNPDKAIYWISASEGKMIQETPHVIFVNPLDKDFHKLTILSEAYYKKQDVETALKYAIEAHKIRPTFESQIDHLKKVQRRNTITKSIKSLAVELLDNHEIYKLESLTKSLPFWFKELPEYSELAGGVQHYMKPAGNDLTSCKNPEEFLAEFDKKLESKELTTARFEIPMPGELRTFSLRDIEELITSRKGRRILNLRYEPDKIVLEYNLSQPNFLVRMFCGQGLEYWSPQTIKNQGCGGSETSAAMVCKEWAKDAIPFLYAMDNQVWDGVIYRTNYKPSPCNLLISSRVPEVLADDIVCEQKWLWLHDTDVGDRLKPQIAEQIDSIICLSQWHAGHIKRVYPFLKDCEVIDYDNNSLTYEDLYTNGCHYPNVKLNKLPKIAIIGDGIDLSRWKNKVEKKKHSFVWTSSPDRGLLELLTIWGDLKAQLPDATLKIYYGWDYFDKYLHIQELREYKEKVRKLLKQDGVEWVGRVGQDALVDILLGADAYIYPPHSFRETYGITFIECQMSEVLCFYRENGALGETIGNRGVPIPMDATNAQIIDLVVKNIDTFDRSKGKEYSLTRSWSNQTEK